MRVIWGYIGILGHILGLKRDYITLILDHRVYAGYIGVIGITLTCLKFADVMASMAKWQLKIKLAGQLWPHGSWLFQAAQGPKGLWPGACRGFRILNWYSGFRASSWLLSYAVVVKKTRKHESSSTTAFVLLFLLLCFLLWL